MKNSLINSLKTKEPYLEIKTLLKNCTHKQQVQFALLAAKSAGEFYDKSKYPEIYSSCFRVFKLIEKWLENPKNASRKELEKAVNELGTSTMANGAYLADNAVNIAVNAADAAYFAAKVACVADAAYAAANAAAYAAYAASNAAIYVTQAANASNIDENEHYQLLLFELIKIIAVDKNYNIAALEVLYRQV